MRNNKISGLSNKRIAGSYAIADYITGSPLCGFKDLNLFGVTPTDVFIRTALLYLQKLSIFKDLLNRRGHPRIRNPLDKYADMCTVGRGSGCGTIISSSY